MWRVCAHPGKELEEKLLVRIFIQNLKINEIKCYNSNDWDISGTFSGTGYLSEYLANVDWKKMNIYGGTVFIFWYHIYQYLYRSSSVNGCIMTPLTHLKDVLRLSCLFCGLHLFTWVFCCILMISGYLAWSGSSCVTVITTGN